MKGPGLENSELPEQESDSRATLEAAWPAEKAQRAVDKKKKKKKKTKVMDTAPYLEQPVANIHIGPPPIPGPPSMLPMFQPLPFHPQQAFSHYGYFYGSPPYPATPLMGSVYHGQPYVPPMPHAATNINCFNNSEISGGISISNTTMNSKLQALIKYWISFLIFQISVPCPKPGPQRKRPRQ